jgi:hypothetical protein
MIIFVYCLPNVSGLVCAKNLRKWAEKAFASSKLAAHFPQMSLSLSLPFHPISPFPPSILALSLPAQGFSSPGNGWWRNSASQRCPGQTEKKTRISNVNL